MIRRARPLLGTIVAISADVSMAGMDAAFAAIERVHCLMSAQQGDSDIARINREGHLKPVSVDRWTVDVLEQAQRISERTQGAFDVVMPGAKASYADLLLAHARVRLARPATIDVSGIAKGFAVDRAVEVLQAYGASAGSVNAGGDLRFFGDWPARVRVRMPSDPCQAVDLPPSPYCAFATSSGYFGSSVADPHSGCTWPLEWSITIAAHTCLVADALTKAIALLGPVHSLLKAFDAAAFAVDRAGQLHAAAL